MTQLRWQCRRGMKELDELLLGYLERYYDSAGDGDKAAFRQLLDLPDPELVAYLLKKEQPSSDLQRVVDKILDRTHT